MHYTLQQLAHITNGQLSSDTSESEITSICYDSRLAKADSEQIFVALISDKNDGHRYIAHAYQKGIRSFLLSRKAELPNDNISYIMVDDTLDALQQIAAHHRDRFGIDVIGITGSNGKTIIKEWLSELLSPALDVAKTPRSYNSQLGVPLSVLKLDDTHEIAVLEAGISRKGEMKKLAKVIKPTVGIFCNIGDAHNLGFKSLAEKIEEKLKLFAEAKKLIYCADHQNIANSISEHLPKIEHLSWSLLGHPSAKSQLVYSSETNSLSIKNGERDLKFELPKRFRSRHDIENLCHCLVAALAHNITQDNMQTALSKLVNIHLRLELKHGEQGNLIIDDSYSLDRSSLEVALDFLSAHSGKKAQVLVLTDFEDQSVGDDFYQSVVRQINHYSLDTVVLIGQAIQQISTELTAPKTLQFANQDQLISYLDQNPWSDSAILIKGARKYRLDRLSRALTKLVHQTVLEIDLSALDHNLGVYINHITDNCGIIAVIKADAYGSGSVSIAKHLEDKVSYFAVAFTDEAIELRQSGIQTRIMVLNPERDSFDKLWEFGLEPQIYSTAQLGELVKVAEYQDSVIRIHLKVDTGMHRLGFEWNLAEQSLELLAKSPVEIASIFSHLSASDDKSKDSYNRLQIERFDHFYQNLCEYLDYSPERHLLNSGGALRFPQAQYNHVRLGIGMYGVGLPSDLLTSFDLKPVHTLRTQISQILDVPVGESIGYGHHNILSETKRIATLNIGYADGLIRSLGNGKGRFIINGQSYPTIGNICMDSCMIDISGSENITEKMDVEIFGAQNKLDQLSQAAGTICYEILSRISKRIKKVYVSE